MSKESIHPSLMETQGTPSSQFNLDEILMEENSEVGKLNAFQTLSSAYLGITEHLRRNSKKILRQVGNTVGLLAVTTSLSSSVLLPPEATIPSHTSISTILSIPEQEDFVIPEEPAINFKTTEASTMAKSVEELIQSKDNKIVVAETQRQSFKENVSSKVETRVHTVEKGEWAIKILIKEGFITDAELGKQGGSEEFMRLMKPYLEQKVEKGEVSAEKVEALQDFVAKYPDTPLYDYAGGQGVRSTFGISEFDAIFAMNPGDELPIPLSTQVTVLPSAATETFIPATPASHEELHTPELKPFAISKTEHVFSDGTNTIDFSSHQPITINSESPDLSINWSTVKTWTHFNDYSILVGGGTPPLDSVTSFINENGGAVVGIHSASYNTIELPGERIREKLEGGVRTFQLGENQIRSNIDNLLKEEPHISIQQGGSTIHMELIAIDYIQSYENDAQLLEAYNYGRDTLSMVYCGRSHVEAINMLIDYPESHSNFPSEYLKYINILNDPFSKSEEIRYALENLKPWFTSNDINTWGKFMAMFNASNNMEEIHQLENKYNYRFLGQSRYVLRFRTLNSKL